MTTQVIGIETEQTRDVETRALTTIGQAEIIRVVDAETYLAANDVWKRLGELLEDAHREFDPIVKSTDKAHKDAVALRKKVVEPLEGARTYVKGLMSDYDAEQERIRVAEERRLAEEARKAEEARRAAELAIAEAARKVEEARLMEEAQKAEAEGNKARAEAVLEEAVTRVEEMKAEEVAIVSEPIETPVVILEKAVPKVAGGPSYRTIWDAQVTDLMALVKAVAAGQVSINALTANQTFLRQQAMSLKDTMRIPGVKAFSRRV